MLTDKFVIRQRTEFAQDVHAVSDNVQSSLAVVGV
jgi:hypothetical protein